MHMLMNGITIGVTNQAINKTTDIIISSTIATTKSFYSIIGYIKSWNQPQTNMIVEELYNMDLEFFIQIINELINERNDETNIILKAILGINEILEKINKELVLIDEMIKYHNSKYFNYFRTFDCNEQVNLIKKYKNILDKRYKVFIDLLKIYK